MTERANLLGYIWEVKKSIWSPLLLKITVGLSESSVEDVYLRYTEIDGKKVIFPEEALKAEQEYREAWLPFEGELYLQRNGEFKKCWG